VFTFIKKLFTEGNSIPKYRLSADDARKIIQNKSDSERLDYENRRQFLLKSVYEKIRNVSANGMRYVSISSEPFSAHLSHNMCWCQEDIDWFAEDFKEVFVADGYYFTHAVNEKTSWRKKRILIQW